LFVWYQLLERPRRPVGRDGQQGSFLGPRFTTDEVARFLGRVAPQSSASLQRYDDEAELLESVAALLADGKVIGWFQGRMEFGPRALGARSILGDPRSPTMQATMNLKIKFRESFRPFAPVVMEDRTTEWFELEPGQESPYMLLVAPVRAERRTPIDPEALATMERDPDLRRRVNVVRSEIPAVTHVDYSARLQTVDEERNGRFYRLMAAFERLTGCPVLVNTSFNVRGEPIVCTPEDAYRCFLATEMDALVLEDIVIVKDAAARAAGAAARQEYLAQFQLD
jgi:carbamoyltransferase